MPYMFLVARVPEDDTKRKLTRKCAGGCGHTFAVVVAYDDLQNWSDGDLVQECFSYLTPAQREQMFLSGICAYCWIKIFAEPEKEASCND